MIGVYTVSPTDTILLAMALAVSILSTIEFITLVIRNIYHCGCFFRSQVVIIGCQVKRMRIINETEIFKFSLKTDTGLRGTLTLQFHLKSGIASSLGVLKDMSLASRTILQY